MFHWVFEILWVKTIFRTPQLKILTTPLLEMPKGPINLALTDPEEFFKQHLIKKEEQPSYWKMKSMQKMTDKIFILHIYPWIKSRDNCEG